MNNSFQLCSHSSLPQPILYALSTDIINFDKVMPNHFRSIDVIESNDDLIITKEHLVFMHIPITIKAYHKIIPPEIHEVEIASWPLSGTRFVEHYIPDTHGTTIIIDVSPSHYIKFFKPLNYFVQKMMLNTLDQFIAAAEMYESKR